MTGPRFPDPRTIVFERTLGVSLQRAWEAITSKPDLDKWFMVTRVQLHLGGSFAFEGGWSGTIGELEPLRKIRWDSSATSYTLFELEADGTQTRFRLTDRLRADAVAKGAEDSLQAKQPGGPGTHWVGAAAGWQCFADSLKGYVEAGEPTENDFHELCQHFDTLLRERFG